VVAPRFRRWIEHVTRARVLPAIERLRAWLSAQLRRRVIWLTDARRDVFGRESSAAALVAVLGREHYAERRKSYPVRGWRDLTRVLRLELAVASPTLTLIGPIVNDRREVTFFELLPGSLERIDKALWVIPESLALSATLPAQRVAVVTRAGLTYFLGSSGVSQIAGGAVRTAALFAIAAGLDPDLEPLDLGAEDARPRILIGLGRLGASAWFGMLRPGLRLAFGLAWRPRATLAAAGMAVYLLLGSGYLSVTQSLRERELKSLGPEVATLLESQRSVETLAREQHGLAKVLNERQLSYPLWRVVAHAWQKGAAINGLGMVEGHVTLRGNAPSATDVLGTLAADPGVREARFGAPVRQTGGREEFVITLTLTGTVNDG
jgi:hypothetical protein